MLDGVFFGVEYDDTNNYMIKPVLPDFCVISSIENGVYRFAFDLNYFTSKTLIYLPQYGADFIEAYNIYRGVRDEITGKWIQTPDNTKRWFEPKNQICIKYDEEVPWIVPPFAGIFKAIIDLDTYEEIKKDGLASIIKYEGDGDTLVWKHPIEDFNLGSQLIVHESQEAIFFKDGKALDLFGAGRYTLATQNIPMLENLQDWSGEMVHGCLSGLAEVMEMKPATMMWPVRIAAAGKSVTPGGATDICGILGQKETIRRLKLGLAKI